MNFLVLYTHQTWPMHYFHAGVLARALMNEGNNVLWVNCERTMPGCHAHWIVPSVSPDDICNACESRGSWLDDMGIPHQPLSAFLTDQDRADAERVRQIADIRTLKATMDGDCPIGELSLSSPVSASRMISLDDPSPSFLKRYQDAVASGLLVNRAIARILPQHDIQRMLLHLGRLVPERVAQHWAHAHSIPWFCFETGALRNTMRLYRESTVYNRAFFRDRWPAFAETPLTVEQIDTVQEWLFLRRKDRRKAGMYTYSPSPTSARVMFDQLKLAPTQKLAVLFTSSVDEMNMLAHLVDPTWRSTFEDQYAFVLEAIEWARLHSDWSLVVRIHPNEGARANHLGMTGQKSLNRYLELLQRTDLPPNLRVVPPDAPVSSYTLMEIAALGLVWASTAGLEMACMGRAIVVADNPPYRLAGFTWNAPGTGHLAETIDEALTASPESLVDRAVQAQRYAYHQAIRYILPFPLVTDHGRMERISLTFGTPDDLRFGRWPGLDKALNYLQYDRFPYPTERQIEPGDARWERASIQRMLAPAFKLEPLPPAPESIQTRADFVAAAPARGIHPDDAAALYDDLLRVLRGARPEGPIVTFGPVGPVFRAMAPARSHLLVDHRGSDVIEAEMGGRPSHLPLKERCLAAAVVHGLPGSDPRPELLAVRRWLQPGALILVVTSSEMAGAGDADVLVTAVGLRHILEELGFRAVVVREQTGGAAGSGPSGLVATAVVPGTVEEGIVMLARRDVLSQVLPPVRREDKKISTPDGKRVLLVRRGNAWSAWPDDLHPAQPVPDYYRFDRPEVRGLVPPGAKRVLDVGCAGGGLGAGLKRERPSLVVDGIEVVPHAARMADGHLDQVFVGPVEQVHVQLEDGVYDCIVFADVLEHTVDPVEVLRLLRPKLKADGVIVVSLPNIRHWTVVGPLLEGKFDYEDAGILDRTHLRFFTKQTMAELFHHNGFEVAQIQKVNFGGEAPAGMVDALKAQGLAVDTLQDESGAYQYLLVCNRRPETRERLTSIVLLAWNQVAYTKLCIESVFRHTHAPFELILVDNGSSDGTPEYFREVRAANPNVKIVLNPKNLGFAKGCNQGLAAANGEYVCFLNNDTIVTEGWLETLQWWAEIEPHVGIVGPVSNRVAGIQRISPVDYDEEDMTAEGIARIEAYGTRYKAANREQSVFVNRIIGLCLLVKRAVVERIGGFDTRYGTGNFEDDDLCFRARVAGYKIVIARDVFIHHYGSKTFEGNKVDYTATLERNMERFLKKWGFERAENGYKPTGLESISYDRAKHFAPFGAEEGFRSDGRPLLVEEARKRNVLVVPPWGEDDALTAVLRVLAPLTGEVSFWVRCPPYEGKSYLSTLEKLAKKANIAVKADLRVVDAPLAPDREAGLYLASSAVYVLEDWPDADLVLRRAADCGLHTLRSPEELAAYVSSP